MEELDTLMLRRAECWSEMQTIIKKQAQLQRQVDDLSIEIDSIDKAIKENRPDSIGKLFYVSIGKKIKIHRTKAKWTQEHLAEKLGYSSPSTISQFELGLRKVSVEDLYAIAWLLGVRMDDLIDDNNRVGG